MTSGAIQQVWFLSLAICAVAAVALAVLLSAILAETKRVHAAVSAIWDGGQRVTNNIVYLALLADTTCLAGALFETAARIAETTEATAEDQP